MFLGVESEGSCLSGSDNSNSSLGQHNHLALVTHVKMFVPINHKMMSKYY